jgi:lipid-A-disaccharide synthase
MKDTVMLVAGEASGDEHAAKLVKSLRMLNPDVRFIGMGGKKMRAAGVELLVDSTKLAVVGLIEILAHYREIRSAFHQIQAAVRDRPPDLLILVDYPGFNLRLAATAKKAGVKVLYYISPQVWAWRPGRVKTIAKRVDMMAVILPFEVSIYDDANVPVRFTGHPLLDEVKPSMTREQSLETFQLEPKHKILGLFPGSRQSEIKRLMPVILDSARILTKRFPDLLLVLPIAPGLEQKDFRPWLDQDPLPIIFTQHAIYDVIQICDAIITASGTATLQIALLGTPMAIIYKISPITYWIARILVNVKHVGLANIVAQSPTVREFIQHKARPDLIADEITRLLTDSSYATQMRRRLLEVRDRLGTGQDSIDIAVLVNGMLTGEY